MPSSTPTAQRRELTRFFHNLRQQRGYQLERLSDQLDVSVSTASRIDSGVRPISVDEAEKLADLYELPPRERSRILKIARLAQGKPWWEEDARVPKAARDFIGFEQAATAIAIFSSGTVPGLFQTAEHARALVRATDPTGDDALQEITVRNRLRRQEILDNEDPPRVRAVLDEAVVRRRVGSPDVQRGQLQALIDASRRPRVSLQILPFEAGAHVGMDSRFTMIFIDDSAKPDLVHIEGLIGYQSREGKTEIARYQQAWQSLLAAALPINRTRDLLTHLIELDSP